MEIGKEMEEKEKQFQEMISQPPAPKFGGNYHRLKGEVEDLPWVQYAK